MSGVILLLHGVHDEITVDEVRPALPGDNPALYPILLQPVECSLAKAKDINWGEAEAAQARLVDGEMRQRLAQQPGLPWAYFGLAPVPLAMHLGFLVGRLRRGDVFQRSHDARTWRWNTTGATDLSVTTRGLPTDSVRSADDVIVRVSVTGSIDPGHTLRCVPGAGTEIDLEVTPIAEDVLRSADDLVRIRDRFKEVMDRIAEKRPNARTVHVFAAIPCGLAFQLGTVVSQTTHPRVQTYHYARMEEPPHQPAIVLGTQTTSAPTPREGDRAAAADLRRSWDAELGRLRGLCKGSGSWVERILPEAAAAEFGGAWRHLATLEATVLSASSLDLETTDVPGGFLFDRASAKWQLSDGLLGAITRRLREGPALARAGRLLLLHEALHLESHRLTDATAVAIRRFPKVVEEVDYQADVWGILHELALSRGLAGGPSTLTTHVAEIVRTALETMWAFNETGGELEELEVRRVNRYLIWYWQGLRLERCKDEVQMARVLARKPTLELCGPRVRAGVDRIFCSLRQPWIVQPELGLLCDDNSVVRQGHSGATDIDVLLEGLRQRDGERIRSVLRSVLDQNQDRLRA